MDHFSKKCSRFKDIDLNMSQNLILLFLVTVPMLPENFIMIFVVVLS